MKYLFLSLAIVLEVCGSAFLKLSDGYTKLIPTLIFLVLYAGCFYFFSLALRMMSLGMAYAI